jgi:hypothetical protein
MTSLIKGRLLGRGQGGHTSVHCVEAPVLYFGGRRVCTFQVKSSLYLKDNHT